MWLGCRGVVKHAVTVGKHEVHFDHARVGRRGRGDGMVILIGAGPRLNYLLEWSTDKGAQIKEVAKKNFNAA